LARDITHLADSGLDDHHNIWTDQSINRLNTLNMESKVVGIKTEEFLKEKKKDLLKMTDEDLPSVLQEMGVSSFTLDDGSKVEIKPLYAGHISANNKEAAFEWLRNNGHDDIIKNVVSCQFGRGEDNKAEEFYAIASAKGYVAQQKQDVHASTLKAWIRERVENGEEFPMEVFGAYISQRATIKGGK